MKKAFLFLLLFVSYLTQAQSLKEALFSGKLKNEPGSVIRRGDDLRTKMDTVARKEPARDTLAVIMVNQALDSAQKKTVSTTPAETPAKAVQDTATIAAAIDNNTATTATNPTQPAITPVEGEITTNAAAAAAVTEPAKPKDNTALWKEYMNNLIPTLKAEVLSSKKVKKESYYVLLSYAIGTDGQVTITDVFVSPENDFLQQQLKDRIALEAPKLNPVLNDAGVPRKVNKKYNFTLVKE